VVKERCTCPSSSPEVLSSQVRGHVPRGCRSVGRAPALQVAVNSRCAHLHFPWTLGSGDSAIRRSIAVSVAGEVSTGSTVLTLHPQASDLHLQQDYDSRASASSTATFLPSH
jgi:hypothetical protein